MNLMERLYGKRKHFHYFDTEKNFLSFYIFKKLEDENKSLLNIFEWTLQKIKSENNENDKLLLQKKWNSYQIMNKNFVSNYDWKKPKYFEKMNSINATPRLILNFLYKYKFSVEEFYIYLDLFSESNTSNTSNTKELLIDALKIFSEIHYYMFDIDVQCLYNYTMHHYCPIKSIKCPDEIHWHKQFHLLMDPSIVFDR